MGVETEIRFGQKTNRGFSSAVNANKWTSLFKKFDFDMTQPTSDCIIGITDNNIRLFWSYPQLEFINAEHKKRISDDTHEHYRISVSQETPVSNINIDKCNIIHLKRRRRWSINQNLWRIDLSIINVYKTLDINKITSSVSHSNIYQFEIEWIHSESIQKNDIKTILSNKNIVEFITMGSQEKIVALLQRYNFTNVTNLSKIPKRPISLDRTNTHMIDNNYYVTAKIDGFHCFILIDEKGMLYIVTDNIQIVFEIQYDIEYADTIIEAELVGDKQVYIIDILYTKGKDVRMQTLKERLQILQSFNFTMPEYNIAIKTYYQSNSSNTVWELCKKILDDSYEYKIDGIIFRAPGNYNEPIFKYKSLDQYTLDFLAIKQHLVLELYCTIDIHTMKKQKIRNINKSEFSWLDETSIFKPYLVTKTPHLITEANESIDTLTIVECRYQKPVWIPIQIRKDKTLQFNEALKLGQFEGPNHKRVVDSTIKYLHNPITYTEITTGNFKNGYFVGVNRDNNINLAMNKFHNFVKSHLINQYVAKNSTILEIGGGRGGDIFKLITTKPEEILLTDIDQLALDEAQRRIDNALSNNKFKWQHPYLKKIRLQQVDATQYDKALLTTSKKKFNIVLCQFAIHYFFKNKDTFDNFYKLINRSLIKNGYLVVTLFDGLKVANLMKSESIKQWHLQNELVLSIEKKWNEINTFGTILDVFVHSIGKHPEYLVNILDFINLMNKHYLVIDQINFEELYDPWVESNPMNKLSENIKEFSFLYTAIVFKKK